jgi:hypothetical protein
VCHGDAERFSGWALDDRGVASVTIEAIDETGAARPLADATWATGTRPDVAGLFSWLPNSSRAQWDYQLPCGVVSTAPGGALRVRVTAVDGDGHRTELGTRLVKAGSPKS